MWQAPRRPPESMPPQRQPIRPDPPTCVVPLELEHFLYISTNTPPRLAQPRQRGLRLLPQWFRHALFTSCAHPSLLSHNIIFQTGRRPNGRCLRFLVRYIYMRFRPTPAEFNGATAAFLRPNWPCLLYTSPSPRDQRGSRMPSSA